MFHNDASELHVLNKLHTLLHHDLSQYHWIDGTNHVVKIRSAALPELMSYLWTSCTDLHFYVQDQLLPGLVERTESPLFKTTRLIRMFI